MRRRLLTIVLLLLAGAVVNVGVAWGCAVWLDIREGEFRRTNIQIPDGNWGVFRWERAGAVYVMSNRIRIEDLSEPPVSGLDVQSGASDPRPEDLVPSWSTLSIASEAFKSGARLGTDRFADGRGWPFISLVSEFETTDQVAPPGGLSRWESIKVYDGVEIALDSPLKTQSFFRYAPFGPASRSTRSSTPHSSGRSSLVRSRSAA